MPASAPQERCFGSDKAGVFLNRCFHSSCSTRHAPSRSPSALGALASQKPACSRVVLLSDQVSLCEFCPSWFPTFSNGCFCSCQWKLPQPVISVLGLCPMLEAWSPRSGSFHIAEGTTFGARGREPRRWLSSDGESRGSLRDDHLLYCHMAASGTSM